MNQPVRAVAECAPRGCLVYAQDYPGAFARAPLLAEALAKLPADAAAWSRWAGAPYPQPGDCVTVVQRVFRENVPVEDADTELLFNSERAQMKPDEYRLLKALVLRSAQDVQRLYDSIPEKNAALLPPRATFYGEAPRTAREMLAHIDIVSADYPGKIGAKALCAADLANNRAAALSAIEAVPRYFFGGVVTDSAGEPWSLRKVLRRFLWHDRIHARAMFRRAAARWGAGAIADPFGFLAASPPHLDMERN
ncbi:MAG: hypothetical protein LBG83_02185 [Oscillospiraceae bacterium]|jgi:hypothetical protein|nr:hypothetical protein [Oscillospiraceae bacterium]